MKTFLFLLYLWFSNQAKIAVSQNTTTEKRQAVVKKSCGDYYNETSGVRVIKVPNYKDVEVYCDQDTDGGGWNVFQRRQDGSGDFYRGWSDYRNGFGDPRGEFWLGLETLHQMTNDGGKYELRVDFQQQDWEKNYAVHDDFYIASEVEGYALHVTGYRGNAGNDFARNNGMKFSTKDRDNDNMHSMDDLGFSCAQIHKAGWWFNKCTFANLNGLYNNTPFVGEHMYWWSLTKDYAVLKNTEMKFRIKQEH